MIHFSSIQLEKSPKTMKRVGMILGIAVVAIGAMILLKGPGGQILPLFTEQGETVVNTEQSTELEDGPLQIQETYMIPLGTDNYFDYQPGMECAAFASAFLLRHYGEDVQGMTLFKTFPSRAPDGGTMPNGIVTLFEARGFHAEYVEGGTVENLKEELSKGNPVIVFIHVEEPYTTTHNTHYVPLVGYDSEYFYFAESLSAYANYKDEPGLSYNRKTEISKFERLWANIDGVWDYPYYVISPGAS